MPRLIGSGWIDPEYPVGIERPEKYTPNLYSYAVVPKLKHCQIKPCVNMPTIFISDLIESASE